MQNFIQKSTIAKFTGATTASATLTGVSAGNDLLGLLAVNVFSANTVVASVSDGNSYELSSSELYDNNNQAGVLLFRRRGVSAGSYTAIATLSPASPGPFGQFMLVEFSGNANNAADQTAVATATGTAISVGPTGTLSSANELLISILGGNPNNSLAGINASPTGFTNLYQDTADTENACSFDYKIVTVNTAVTANYGSANTSGLWGASLTSFIAATAVSVSSGGLMLRGVG